MFTPGQGTVLCKSECIDFVMFDEVCCEYSLAARLALALLVHSTIKLIGRFCRSMFLWSAFNLLLSSELPPYMTMPHTPSSLSEATIYTPEALTRPVINIVNCKNLRITSQLSFYYSCFFIFILNVFIGIVTISTVKIWLREDGTGPPEARGGDISPPPPPQPLSEHSPQLPVVSFNAENCL